MGNGRATAAALLVMLAACARCSRPTGAPPERFLASDSAAVLVPSVRAAQQEAAAVAATAGTFAAAADSVQTLAAVKEQLGFDPFDPAALEGVGVDVSRGAALGGSRGQPPLLVLPVRDEDKLASLAARLARDRLGAARSAVVQASGAAVTVYRSSEGAAPALSMSFADGNALLVTGADGPERISAALARPRSESLAGSPAFARARTAAGATSTMLAYVPPGAPDFRGVPLLRDGAAFGVSGSATQVRLRAVLLLAPERRAWWSTSVAPGAARDAATVGRLPAGAFFVGRFDGDVATVVRRVLPVDALARPLEKAGVELERDLLGVLERGAALSLAVAPTFQVGNAGRASDLVASDPFKLAHLYAVLHVKDETSASALLQRLSRAGPQLGIRVTPASGGTGRWRITKGDAEIDVALDGHRLLVGGGPGSLAALSATAEPRYAAPTEPARAALTGGFAGAVVDFQALVASFRALPPEAYGTGPDAFVMRSLAERFIEPASRLVAASLRADLVEEAAILDLALEAKPVESRPAGAVR